jgi:phosphate starvation-inducible protein PhoH
MIIVDVMQVTIVEIIDVPGMADSGMAAIRAVLVRVIGVPFSAIGHVWTSCVVVNHPVLLSIIALRQHAR